MKSKILVIIVLVVGCITATNAKKYKLRLREYPVSVIPAPVSMTQSKGMLQLPIVVSCDPQLSAAEIKLIEASLRTKIHSSSKVERSVKPFIKYTIDNRLDSEAYTLRIDSSGIEIQSADATGRLWAVQTLRQIIDCAAYFQQGDVKALPYVFIEDRPRHEWRGFHTDVSRHMFTIEYLREIVDRMSYLKLNKFHIHLTDDQGWRMEIERYPLLTKIGSVRDFNDMDSLSLFLSQYAPEKAMNPKFIPESGRYGGYYTKNEMRELVKYAMDRGVDIVPEIDMPGHLSAAQRAYPFLSCTATTGKGREFSYPMCVGNPQSIQFAKHIIDELCEIFPSEYIHLGADEVERDNWENCPRCNKLMRQYKMKNTVEIQSYFVRELTDYIKIKGRKPIVWDDVFEEQAPLNVDYMYWRDWVNETPKKILHSNRPFIWTSWDYFYLSSGPSDRQFRGIYEFDPKDKYGIEQTSSLKGWQACMWTEHVFNEKQHQWHMYPALYAFAERAWGTISDFEEFVIRMKPQYYNMTIEGIVYRTPSIELQ